MSIYVAHHHRKTSNALDTLELSEQKCFQWTSERLVTTSWIMEVSWQRIPSRWSSDSEGPTTKWAELVTWHKSRLVNSDNRLVWSAAGVCPWPPTLHFVHRWIDRPHRRSRSLTSPVCWWHADPGLLSPWVWRSAPVYPVPLSRWCVGLDVVTNAPRIDTLLSGLAVFDYRPCTLNNF